MSVIVGEDAPSNGRKRVAFRFHLRLPLSSIAALIKCVGCWVSLLCIHHNFVCFSFVLWQFLFISFTSNEMCSLRCLPQINIITSANEEKKMFIFYSFLNLMWYLLDYRLFCGPFWPIRYLVCSTNVHWILRTNHNIYLEPSIWIYYPQYILFTYTWRCCFLLPSSTLFEQFRFNANAYTDTCTRDERALSCCVKTNEC